MEKGKVNQLYEDAWRFMRRENRTELDLNDKPYMNLVSVLYENYQDTTLSMMLLFSAAESLLIGRDNEKKLRLSIIWPRLVTITDKEQKDLCILIRDSYEKRNNFVHAGNLIYDSEKEEIRVLHQMLAKLISKYLSPDEWKDTECKPEEKDINKWTKYVRNIFTDAIYS